MADYRDEKETLRRRVVALERQVERLRTDDAEDDENLSSLRRERDALQEALRELEERNEELSEEVSRLSVKLARQEHGKPDKAWTPARWAGLGAWLSLALAIPTSFYDGGLTLVPLGIAIGLGLAAAMLGRRERRERDRETLHARPDGGASGHAPASERNPRGRPRPRSRPSAGGAAGVADAAADCAKGGARWRSERSRSALAQPVDGPSGRLPKRRPSSRRRRRRPRKRPTTTRPRTMRPSPRRRHPRARAGG